MVNVNSIKWKEETPRISVLMPMYRALYIGWLAMESLSNQRNPGVPWELVVGEEQDDSEVFGLKRITSYADRLVQAGCCGLVHIGLDSWIPLANKFSIMIKNASLDSEIFVFHAADFYSASTRLVRTHKAFRDKHVVWFVPPRVFLYHLAYGYIILVDKTLTRRKDDTPGKAIRARLVRKAVSALRIRETSVDGLLYKASSKVYGKPIPFTIDSSGVWKSSVSVEGLGTLSNKVSHRLFSQRTLESPYVRWNRSLETIVPSNIAFKIKSCAKYLNKHNPRRPSWIAHTRRRRRDGYFRSDRPSQRSYR